MTTPIPYPFINGTRHSFTSTVVKIDGQEFYGYTKIDHSRKRDRKKVWGNNPDPLGKTRGTNDYELKITVLKAEFKAFVTDHFGAGYGDKSFTTQVSYIENGMDPQDIQALGCTIDEQKLSASQGPDALTVDLDFAPIKIIENGVDDNATPLVGAPAAA